MLTQAEANVLISIEKKAAKKKKYYFPLPGKKLTIPIVSVDEKASFLIDINRGKISLTKCTYQERYKKYRGIIPLIRLDIDGAPHHNPEVKNVPLILLHPYDGKTIPCPHLHLYVEGFMDKWAIPAPSDIFPQITDIYETLYDFFSYCNIIDPPVVERGLF